MPRSAVGRAVDYLLSLLVIILEVVDSNPKTCSFFPTLFFFPNPCIFGDIADHTEKNFQGNIASTLSDMLTFYH